MRHAPGIALSLGIVICSTTEQAIAEITFPIETEITVLGVTTGGASFSTAVGQLDYLEHHFPTSDGVTIALANEGLPVPLTTVTYTGSAESQLQAAEGNPDLQGLRETWAADIVIIFTGSTSDGKCGLARQFNWTRISNPLPGVFIADRQSVCLRLVENRALVIGVYQWGAR